MNRYPGNHMDSGIVTLPRQLKTRPGAPQTHLAYITGDEAQMLQGHKPGTPHKGPHDIPNYDSWDWEGGSIAEGGGWASGSGSSSEQQDYGSGPDLGGAGSTTDFSGGPGPWNNFNTNNNYIPPEEYYTDPIPEDIIYDDKIADYSFSTPDVRSSIRDRSEFRKDTGSEIVTNAENLARMAYELTNDPKYLDQPIFVPEGMSGWQNDELYQSLLNKYKQAIATGDREIFFEALEDLQDITTGNPNTQYFDDVSGTGWDDWYKRPTITSGGDGDGGGWPRRSGWGNPHLNYGNRSGYGKYANWANRPHMLQDFGATDMQDYYARIKNPHPPVIQEKFKNMMANMYNSGIRSLV
jgi:hypothetical protein